MVAAVPNRLAVGYEYTLKRQESGWWARAFSENTASADRRPSKHPGYVQDSSAKTSWADLHISLREIVALKQQWLVVRGRQCI
jgi:hypothetical protein